MAQKLVKFIDLEEFKKVLIAEKDKRFKLAYVLGFGSGLRISEIIGYKGISKKKDKEQEEVFIPPLKKESIDLEGHKIKILGKRGKERITVTNPWLNKTNILLLPLNIPRRTLQARFTRTCEKAIGKKLNFHTLRHGFGNYMVNDKEVPVPMVQQMLGHSRLDTTGIYTKANPKRIIERAWEAF
jgi:integrase/recombinase XerD